MPDTVLCPSCATTLPLQSAAVGLPIQCPKCGHTFRADISAIQPASSSESPAANPRFPTEQRAADAAVIRREDYREHLRSMADDGFPAPATNDPERDFCRRLDVRRRSLPHFAMATPTIILIAAVMAVEAVDVAVSAFYVNELNRELHNPGAGDFGIIELLETVRGFIGAMQFGVSIAAAVLFLVWIHGAHANLVALGAGHLRYSPGWAVGYFFIPFLNLVRPYQVMQEIWRASDPDRSPDDPYAWHYARGSWLASFWWPLWLISNVLSNASFRLGLEQNPSDERLRAVAIVDMAAALPSIVAGILVIILIRAIKKRQMAKYDRMLGLDGDDF